MIFINQDAYSKSSGIKNSWPVKKLEMLSHVTTIQIFINLLFGPSLITYFYVWDSWALGAHTHSAYAL